MRKIVALTFQTLDGVMQAPGGPGEDIDAGFKFGGWQKPFTKDDAMAKITGPAMVDDVDFLLGRHTFDIFEAYWPKQDFWKAINANHKYVLSNSRTESTWQHTTFLKTIEDIKQLKTADGNDLHIWGSSQLVQLLLEHDMIDELRLMTYPIILGQGKKLFAAGAAPRSFTMVESWIGNTGVVAARYARAGDIVTGNVDD